jgi:DNA-directed RNA polymerase alpha subunit
MDISKLEAMPKTELVNLAREAGIPCDGRSSQKAIIAALAAKLTEVTHPLHTQQAEEKPKVKKAEFTTREEIEAICPKNVELTWHGDDTLTATYRGETRSMTQHQHIEVIKRELRWVSRGAIMPQVTKDGTIKEGAYWDKISA